MRKVLSPQRDVLGLLTKRGDSRVSERTALYLRDVYDHLVRINESIESNRDLLGNALDAYLSAVGQRTNEIMKALTLDERGVPAAGVRGRLLRPELPGPAGLPRLAHARRPDVGDDRGLRRHPDHDAGVVPDEALAVAGADGRRGVTRCGWRVAIAAPPGAWSRLAALPAGAAAIAVSCSRHAELGAARADADRGADRRERRRRPRRPRGSTGSTRGSPSDLASGRPLVVQVHVPLCEGTIIACGNAKLGDGDNPRTNLYWATTEGFLGWFGRKGSGWKPALVATGDAIGEADVLDLRVWRRTVATPARWRAAGAPKRVTVYVVAQAWRGTLIDRALARYAEDLFGAHTQAVTLADGTALAAGGDAHVVAYVGHNRLMDLATFDWRAIAARGDERSRGVIAIACHTAPYMQAVVPGPHQVPLVMTRDFLLASAAALEGAVTAFAQGGDYAAVRRGAAAGYADGGDKPLARVFGAFSNPADKRWGTPGYSAAVNAHAAAQCGAPAP
jgi:hypothetical protein